MLALRGSKLMGEVLGGPYHIMLATLLAVEVADVFVGSIRHHGHLWRLPLALRTALVELTAERLCSADSSVRPLLEAGLELLRLVEELGKESWLLYDGSPRGVFRCAKVLNDDGVLVLMEGLGDATLPCGFRLTVFKFYLSVLGCLTLLWDPPHPQELNLGHVAHLRDTFLTR